MPWTKGQNVSLRSGTDGRTVFKGEVLAVTPTGRALCAFTRPDGGTFQRTYLSTGRGYPHYHTSKPINHWTDKDAADFAELCRQHKAAPTRQQTAAPKRAEDRALDREAITYGLALLASKNDQRASRLAKMLTTYQRELGQ
jgi:hypothetical protein